MARSSADPGDAAGRAERPNLRASTSDRRGVASRPDTAGTRGLSLAAVTVREDACWAGAGSSGVARGARVYEKYMEGSSGVDGGCMGPAMPVVCLSIPGAREDLAGGARAVVPGTGESGAEVLLPAGLGSCTARFPASGEPSSRVHSPSRTARMTRGPASWLTGRKARSSQASALAAAGAGAPERRRALKACPYMAARSI